MRYSVYHNVEESFCYSMKQEHIALYEGTADPMQQCIARLVSLGGHTTDCFNRVFNCSIRVPVDMTFPLGHVPALKLHH